jgi:transcription termination factor Rho
MSETQLERSVLEAKDRDELVAIAEALGARPGARPKKADLITEILRATGIETQAGSEAPVTVASEASPAVDPKPRRTRTRRTAATAQAGVATPEKADSVDRTKAKESPEQGVLLADREVVTGPTNSENGDAADATAAVTAEDVEANVEEVVNLPAADEGAPAEASARADGRPSRNGSDGKTAGAASDTPGGDTTSGHEGDIKEQTSSIPNSSRQTEEPTGASRYEGEPGNRRNRRRRGRDRFERPDRDLPGQAVDGQFGGDPIPVSGFLDLRDEGFGFLRTAGFLSGPGDVYVSISQVRRFALRKGDHIEGAARPAGGNEKYPALLRIDLVSGLTPDEARGRPRFENLTPLFPDSRLRLEQQRDAANLTARIVDLISPIGKGQRGMIVSPPKAGKTTILKQIAHSIEANNPEVHLMVLLVDERPEEVTDMRRSVKGEVISSTFDRPAEEHTQVAELAIERAKRMVEMGRDVVIVLDGITRLARAYNMALPVSGRIMSGGLDTAAIYPPKKFFGAARNIEEGGSLTILATALVETGSRMDEVIFEEFKGTGNMELRLDRKLAERRIYPAIDVNASSTRHEELLFDRVQLQQVWKLRRVLNALAAEGSGAPGLELLMDRIKSTRTNDEFLAEVAKNATSAV